MIHRAAFSNFKSLRAVECELTRFTVLVGPNGSGKSSVLDGLHYLAQSTRSRLGGILKGPWSPSSLRSRGATGPMGLELGGAFDGIDARVAIRINFSLTEAGEWDAMVERTWADEEVATRDSPRDVGFRHNRSSPEMTALAHAVGAALRLRLDAQRLAMPSYNEAEEEIPRLHFDGGGLASVLADMAGRMPEPFEAIQAAVRAVVPTLERIRLRPAKVYRTERQRIQIDEAQIVHPVERWVWGHQIVLDFVGAPDVPAQLASEGTLLAVGLMTALHTEPQPRLLLLDDLDQALHPRAQRELIAQVRSVLSSRPELQIVATSHSPYLLDQFDAKEVLLTAVPTSGPDAGSTACASLLEHPDFERWREVARTGELWSFVGEDWVLDRARSRGAA